MRLGAVFLWSFIATAGTSLSVPACKDDGLMAGKCGLEGERVECITNDDCHERDPYLGFCDLRGSCTHWETGCQYIGTFCTSTTVCNSMAECSPGCNSHDECLPGDSCRCFAPWELASNTLSAGWCWTARCTAAGSCPEGHVPDDGLLACWPIEKEGDCEHAVDVDCPPGYEPEGQTGCRLVEPFAWRTTTLR